MKRLRAVALPILLFIMFSYLARSQDISKIYLYGETLLRATPAQGIRFYDISDPKSPRLRSMVKLEGNHDMAIYRGYMYVDNNADLIIYHVGTMQKAPVAVDTIGNIFALAMAQRRPAFSLNDGITLSSGRSLDGGSSRGTSSPTGQGGSLARFTIVGTTLYCINGSDLKVFDISTPERPQYKNSVTIGWDIETLFASGKHLFIGGRQGMYIYDVSQSESPKPVSQFTHARSCDPVVVEGNLAYVTLRSGSMCGGGRSVLEIIDISDIRNPKLLHSENLSGPFGLAVRDQMVVVCDATGLVALNAKDPAAVRRVGEITGIAPRDIILDGNRMIVTAESGFYLYDAHNLAAPKLQSKLVLTDLAEGRQ